MKDLFIASHEELIEDYMLKHPHASWDEAYSRTADGAYYAMQEKLADRADFERDRRREGGE